MSARRLAALAALCGTSVLAGWTAAGFFASAPIETATAPIETAVARVENSQIAVPACTPTAVESTQAAAPAAALEPNEAPQATAAGDAAPSIGEAVAAESLQASSPVGQPETPPVQLAYANTPETLQSEFKPDAPRSDVTSDSPPTDVKAVAPDNDANDKPSQQQIAEECALTQGCIDEYLFALYRRAPKVDSIRVSERVKVTVTKKGKTKTVTKTVSKVVDEDFGWKDPKAAEKVGMPLMNYVIGGMDNSFKLKLYRALRALDAAGLEPGITSGFRDDYRQALASGKKAASDSSYHGGSRRGGYGHGLAADLVSVRGDTRAQRCLSSEVLWKWIDAHGQEYGVGRPYLDRDPPHVGPVDGREYVEKRGLNRTRLAAHAKDKGKAKPAASAQVQHASVQTNKPAAEPANQSKPKAAAPANSQHVARLTNKPRVATVSTEQSKAKPAAPATAQRVPLQPKPQVPAVRSDQAKQKPATAASPQRAALPTAKPHAPAVGGEQTKTKPAASASVQRVALQTTKPHVVAARPDQNKTKRAKTESKPNSI